MRTSKVTLLLCFLVGCSDGEFAGDSGSTIQKKPFKKPITTSSSTSLGSENDPQSQNGLDSDNGGKANICDPKAVEDPNATYSWSSRLRAGDDIRPFVNSFNRYTRVNVGALFFDAATAKFACNLNGYLDQTGFTQGSFHSPGDNNIYRWDPTQKKLLETRADASGNKTLKSYSCKGKLKDPCKKDAGWIFQALP